MHLSGNCSYFSYFLTSQQVTHVVFKGNLAPDGNP